MLERPILSVNDPFFIPVVHSMPLLGSRKCGKDDCQRRAARGVGAKTAILDGVLATHNYKGIVPFNNTVLQVANFKTAGRSKLVLEPNAGSFGDRF